MAASAPQMELQYETSPNHEEHYNPPTYQPTERDGPINQETPPTHIPNNEKVEWQMVETNTPPTYPRKIKLEELIQPNYPHNPNMTPIPANFPPNTYPSGTTTTPHLQNVTQNRPPCPHTDNPQQQPPGSQTAPLIPVRAKAKAQQAIITEPHLNQKPSRKNEGENPFSIR